MRPPSRTILAAAGVVLVLAGAATADPSMVPNPLPFEQCHLLPVGCIPGGTLELLEVTTGLPAGAADVIGVVEPSYDTLIFEIVMDAEALDPRGLFTVFLFPGLPVFGYGWIPGPDADVIPLPRIGALDVFTSGATALQRTDPFFISAPGVTFDGSLEVHTFGFDPELSNRSEAVLVEVTQIEIDIKPGSDANPIEPGSRGVVLVAVLGSEGFDVADVDATTLAFGPAAAPLAHRNGPHPIDLDRDGFEDLLTHFRIQETGIARGDEEACVTGETLDGTPFEGCDAVATLPTQ